MFKYLGSLVSETNGVSVVIKHRLTLVNRYYGLRKHLQSHHIRVRTKCLIYKTLIRPVITYVAECWVLTKKG